MRGITSLLVNSDLDCNGGGSSVHSKDVRGCPLVDLTKLSTINETGREEGDGEQDKTRCIVTRPHLLF